MAAILTITRAYIVAGSPNQTSRRASYEGWSDVVRSALVWLGCPDPVETVAALKADDPMRQQRAAVFSAWTRELFPSAGYQTAELIRLAAEQHYGGVRLRPALWDALLAVAAARGSVQQIDPKHLGKWLSRNHDTIADGHRLTVDRSDKARPRWQMMPA